MKSVFNSFSGVIGVVLTFFGIGFTGFGLGELRISQQLRQEGILASGVVTNRFRASSTDLDVTVYQVSFQTNKGEAYQTENHFGMLDNLYQKGDSVNILYLPDEPETSRFDTERELYSTFKTLLGIGIPLLFIGCLAMIKHKTIDERL